jgi:hypothetical protein
MTARHVTRSRQFAAAALAAVALPVTVLAARGTDTGSAAEAASPVVASGDKSGHDDRPGHDMAAMHNPHVSPRIKLSTTMRSLWDQHMEWTWSTVVAFATDSPALPATLDRLLANQADIGNAVASFYGAKAGDQLTALLKTHINLAVPVLQAAKAGDRAALGKALDDWYANAQDIADFLADANPRNWDRDTMREMMATHITQTTAYASAVLGGDYKTAIATYDQAQAHMSDMADMLSAGIIAQFPRRF